MIRRPGVFFDLYGTLILTHENSRAWDAWQAEFLRFVGQRKNPDAVGKAAELFDEFWSDIEDDPNTGETVFEHKIRQFLGRFDIHETPSGISSLADELCTVWQRELRVDPDAKPLLSRLRKTVSVGLVTNFDHPPHIHRVLQDQRLRDFFDTVVISAEERIKKPDPRILLTACERADCNPERSLYVGDSIVDYEAAVGAGMTPVLIRRSGQGETMGNYDKHTRYQETDAYLEDRAVQGNLTKIENLNEVSDVVREFTGEIS